MPRQPIYSQRFLTAKNASGTVHYANPTPNTWVVKCFTAHYGGSVPDTLSFLDGYNATMLEVHSDGSLIGPPFLLQVWNELQLVWPAGESWTVATGFGWDYTIHGYSLTPP